MPPSTPPRASTRRRSPIAYTVSTVATDRATTCARVAHVVVVAVAAAASRTRRDDARTARETSRACAIPRKSVRVGGVNGPRAERAVIESAAAVRPLRALEPPSPRRRRSMATANRMMSVICRK